VIRAKPRQKTHRIKAPIPASPPAQALTATTIQSRQAYQKRWAPVWSASPVQQAGRIWRSIIFYNFKLVYVPIPKAASSSIITALGTLLGHKISDRHMRRIANFKRIKIDRLKKHRNYFKFTFTRNPWDRLVSCYFDKVLRNKIKLYIGGRYRFTKNTTFEQFASAVCEIKDENSNSHFKSQYTFMVCRGKLIPNFIGKFENLYNDWQTIRMFIPALPKLPHRMATKHRPYKHYYTKDLWEKVRRRYQHDIELFNYRDYYEI
jgi:hypothetical protein